MHKLISTLFIDAIYNTDFNTKDLKFLEDKDFSDIPHFKGINLNSEVVFFYDSWNGALVKGLLFNLSNPKSFKGIPNMGKHIIQESNEQRGIIIYLDEDASKKFIDYYTDFAKKVVSNKVHSSRYSPSSEIMDLSFKGNKSSYIHNLKLNIQLDNEHLLIHGTGKLDSVPPLKQLHLITEPAKKKYFEIQSGKLPDSVIQYINNLTKELNINMPNICSQQMLIYGISIDKVNSAPLILPKMDWVIRFDSTVYMDTILKNINKKLSHIIRTDNFLEIGTLKYYYQQLSDNEIYLGVSEAPEIHKVKMRALPLTKGFPSAILDIEGTGIIAKIITLMPQVRNTKLFLNGVEYYDIHSEYIDGNNLKILGDIRLEKNEMMSIGLAEFISKFF